MNLTNGVFKEEERALYQLRELYARYGYSHFKVSKFEEYDLYANNKSFLVSENVLTFTDTNGKLLALKPDVTLSIVKNMQKGESTTQKLYYNETVYRTSRDYDGFREIMQTGLECIGHVDLYATGEVLMLAHESLSLIHPDSLLVLSHMGLLTGLLESVGIDPDGAAELLDAIKGKNRGGIRSYCTENGIPDASAEALCQFAGLYAPIEIALPEIKSLIVGEKMQASYDQLCAICEMMREYGMTERTYLDFSIVNDLQYYSGVIFQGYVNGLSDAILSGGRYDRLLAKMGKQGGAIGFAVYLSLLERLRDGGREYDADTLLLYDRAADALSVMRAVKELRREGSVLARCEGGEEIYCRRVVRLTAKGVLVDEAND